MPTKPLAVIDLGSNTSRVVVFRFNGRHLETLASSKATLKLARDIDEHHILSNAAIEKTMEAFRDFRALALGAGATRVIALATSAVREASNGVDLIERIRRELKFEVEIIDGDREAKYGFWGAVHSLPVEQGIVFDLGGGSLQISRFQQRRLTYSVSLPLGSLRLSLKFLKNDPPTEREIKKLTSYIAAQLKEAGLKKLAKGEVLIGTGGTARNLAKIDRRAHNYPVPRLHGYTLHAARLDEIIERVTQRSTKERKTIAGLNNERIDSIVGGSLIVRTLLDVLQAETFLVSGQGVREGVAYALLSKTIPGIKQTQDESIRALASRFTGWDEDSAQRRAKIADTLLMHLHPHVAPEIKDALRYAAWVLDIGRSIDFFNRHELVANIVLATDLNGFTHRAIALLAVVLRQAADEKVDAKDFSPLLSKRDQDEVNYAGVILRLADDIEERCPPNKKIEVRFQRRQKQITLTIPQLLGWRAREIDERFAEVFGANLVVKKT